MPIPDNMTSVQKELWMALVHFHETGELPACLVPGFDQNGRWRGMSNSHKALTCEQAHPKLTNYTLPEDRRSQKIGTETYLLTSYFAMGTKTENRISDSISIPYAGIDGRIILDSYARVEFPNLKELHDEILTKDVSHLELPQLSKIAGRATFKDIKEIFAPLLESIGGDLDAPSLKELHLPKLKEILGDLVVLAHPLDLPCLELVKGNFSYQNRNALRLPKLQEVGGSLQCYSTSLEFPSLRNVGHLDIHADEKLVLRGGLRIKSIATSHLHLRRGTTLTKTLIKALSPPSLEILLDSLNQDNSDNEPILALIRNEYTKKNIQEMIGNDYLELA